MSELIFTLTIAAIIVLCIGIVAAVALLLLVLEQKGAELIEWCIRIWGRRPL